jgi:hypothetical protein
MSYDVIQILVLALGLALSGAALIMVALQISKVQKRLQTLESDFVRHFEKKPLLTEEEQKDQITYKEAIKRLRAGQTAEEISKETGVSRRELEALSNILDTL